MYPTQWISPGERLDDAYRVRLEVFVEEQGFSRDGEFDGIDARAHHLVVYGGDGLPVATGRIFEDLEHPGVWIAGRIAVSGKLRGTGVGRMLMEEMEQKAAALGAQRLVLSAQCQAAEFYAKLGYQASGDTYLDEHCPHIHMEKDLSPV